MYTKNRAKFLTEYLFVVSVGTDVAMRRFESHFRNGWQIIAAGENAHVTQHRKGKVFKIHFLFDFV